MRVYDYGVCPGSFWKGRCSIYFVVSCESRGRERKGREERGRGGKSGEEGGRGKRASLCHVSDELRPKQPRVQVFVMEKPHRTSKRIVQTSAVTSNSFNHRALRHIAHVDCNLLCRWKGMAIGIFPSSSSLGEARTSLSQQPDSDGGSRRQPDELA